MCKTTDTYPSPLRHIRIAVSAVCHRQYTTFPCSLAESGRGCLHAPVRYDYQLLSTLAQRIPLAAVSTPPFYYTHSPLTLSLFTIFTAKHSPLVWHVTSFTSPKLPWPRTLPNAYFLSTAPSSSTRVWGRGSGSLPSRNAHVVEARRSTLLIPAISEYTCNDQ